MIRVLQVVTHMNRGGLETMLMNYYRHIDRTQVQFDFLTHRNYDGDYGEEIKSLGGQIYHMPVLNPFSLRYRTALGNFFDTHPEYKIIHVHQDCMSSVILKEAQKHNISVRIAHSHTSNQDKDFKYLIKLWYKQFISKYATHLFSCGDEAGRWMFNGAKYKVLNNAIDAQEYSFNSKKRDIIREKIGINDETLIIGHVGRFSPTKNHSFLIDVFYEVCKWKEARLLLLGDGELRNEMETKVKKIGLSDKVIFFGVQSNISSYLQAMDVFVFPSIYEGLPVTLVEAQAAGLPCLISDKVPIECKKTDLVQQVPLSDGAEKWAANVIEAAKIRRRDTYEEIKAAGFDIEENAKWLQNFYMKR